MKFIDLFGGIGGFSLGLERNGFECVGYYDNNKYAVQTFNKNFETSYEPTDIREVKEFPDFDLLCAGFPCQAFSIAGKRKGFGDTRGTLFFEVARILEIKRPAYILLENVKGLLNHEKGKTFSKILQTLDELGYEVQWMVLNSKFFGIPQNRERVFIIGNLRGQPRPEILPIRKSSGKIDDKHKPTKESVYALTSTYWKGGRGGHIQEPKIAIPVLTPDREKKRQNGRRFKENGEPSFTLTGQDRHGVMITSHSPRTNDPKKGGSGPLESDKHCFTIDRTPHYVNRIRRLTPTECERLQGFPDGWTEGVSDTQRYKQLGNAVTVNVVETIAKELKRGGKT
jgi:DNA (cytosine-5)-methyltransferase 1